MSQTQNDSTSELGHEREDRRKFLFGFLGALGVLAFSRKVSAATYLSSPNSKPNYPYGYQNTFPKGTGDFLTRDQAGGDVFAAGLKPGDTFPRDIVVFDESNKQHSLDEFIGRKPLIMALTLISAPVVMKKIVNFQNFIKSHPIDANVMVIHVGQFGSALQPHTPMADSGRTLKYVASEYHVTLPMYWVKNDIYAPNGFTNRLHVRDLPTIFLIDDQDRVVKEFGSDHTQWTAKDFALA